MRKIGIYGGTFDPIHHGHLILGRQACEELGLDRLIFVPAALSPFKKATHARGEARMSMLRAAVEGELMFTVNDCELQRPPPSYSIDTVLQIHEREPDAELFWLIGADNVDRLSNWHRFEDLNKLVKFVVLDRAGAIGRQRSRARATPARSAARHVPFQRTHAELPLLDVQLPRCAPDLPARRL